MFPLQTSTLAGIIAAILLLIFMYKAIAREKEREKELLNKIKTNLLPTLTQNLQEIIDKLEDIQRAFQEKVKFTQILRRNVSYALLVDFKEHFYKIGTEIKELQEQLQQLDNQIEQQEQPTQ